MALLTEAQLLELQDKMPYKEQVFCELYVTGLSIGAAMSEAGYSPRTASSAGVKMLKKSRVQRYLKHLKTERSLETKITAERVLQELAIIGFSDIADMVEFDGEKLKLKSFAKMGKNTKALQKFKVSATGEIEFVKENKLKALEMLAKHTELVPSEENTIVNEVQININHRKKGSKLDK